jgi:hypothetical protein
VSDHENQPPQEPYVQQPTYGQAASGQPPQVPYGQQTAYGQPGPGDGGAAAKGFFGALFDFGFNHFVTPMIVKVVYVLATVALGLGWLIMLVSGFATEPAVGVLVLLLGPFVVLLYLCFIRMTLEFYLSVVRMSQDIHQRLR